MNKLKFEQMVRLPEYLANTKINESDFLSLVIEENLTLYAYIDIAELAERDEGRQDRLVEVVTSCFMPIHPGAFYTPYLTGSDLTGNFLKTEKPIESWLPDYEEVGLHYVTTPSTIKRDGIFILKSLMNPSSDTPSRPNDTVEILEDWSQIKINGQVFPLQPTQKDILSVLHRAAGPVSSRTLFEKSTHVSASELSYADVIRKDRHPEIDSLVLKGDGKSFLKSQYMASPALRRAKVLDPRKFFATNDEN